METQQTEAQREEVLQRVYVDPNRISVLRKQRGLTIVKLAQGIGLTTDGFHKLMSRTGGDLHLSKVGRLAATLGCHPSELIVFEGFEPTSFCLAQASHLQ